VTSHRGQISANAEQPIGYSFNSSTSFSAAAVAESNRLQALGRSTSQTISSSPVVLTTV